jgi:hypothetical protein
LRIAQSVWTRTLTFIALGIPDGSDGPDRSLIVRVIGIRLNVDNILSMSGLDSFGVGVSRCGCDQRNPCRSPNHFVSSVEEKLGRLSQKNRPSSKDCLATGWHTKTITSTILG